MSHPAKGVTGPLRVVEFEPKHAQFFPKAVVVWVVSGGLGETFLAEFA
jgi:hypothetical protein